MPLESGVFNVTPYAVGRFTAYSQDFESYSGNNDQARLWGETGVRVATTVQRIDDSIRSRALDVNRVRHIITPSVTGSVSGSTLPSEDLPVYDDAVEALNEGGTIALRLDQTWQTKRGGPGRERSVDWITVDTELVLNSEDDDLSPYPRYFGFRNELSKPGDFIGISGTWQVSEVFGLTGSTAYDFNTSQQTRTAAGLVLRHSDDFITYADLLYLQPARFDVPLRRHRLQAVGQVRPGDPGDLRPAGRHASEHQRDHHAPVPEREPGAGHQLQQHPRRDQLLLQRAAGRSRPTRRQHHRTGQLQRATAAQAPSAASVPRLCQACLGVDV